jgi:endonuclease-3
MPPRSGSGVPKVPPTSKVRPGPAKSVIPAPRGQAPKRTDPGSERGQTRVRPPGKRSKRIPVGELRGHAQAIYERLHALYPDAHCELDFRDAWELVQATILSAQCTDKRVNMVTPTLFAAYPTPAALARARQEDVEEIIRSTGFFRNKARNLIAMAGAVEDRHGGQVPPSMDDLVKLPGVGRKTANVVLGNACNINEGVVVDTHVQRLSARLGLTIETDPEKIERVLMALYEREQWTLLSHLLIWHGRRICDARKPRCSECVLNDICPSAFRVQRAV